MQESVIRSGLYQAGVEPDRVSCIEAHGTGTPLGDPIEMRALTRVFRREHESARPCHVTSVKANIGHTETASGIAGLIKVVLMLRHHEIGPQVHFERLNPRISLEGSRLVILREAVEWQARGSLGWRA